MISEAGRGVLTPRTKLVLALPVIAALVIVLVYFQLFSSPVVIAVIFVAYVVVSLRNRRKFRRQREKGAPSTARVSG
jgi:ABC-type nitrate/sulfonate/bicarbonate transport system permease component